MSNHSNPIGVFDSGIGGLTVVRQLFNSLPNEKIIYFGDTARVPYGSKSNSTVIEYSFQDARFLISKNVKLIVVACNTASSIALEELRSRIDIPIIGMIDPGVEAAISSTINGRIGVIGTRATVNNKAYFNKIHEYDNKIQVFERSCPLFVPLAEEGWISHKATHLIAEEYLKDLRELKIDTLILGCTHYPLLSEVIQKVIGKNVQLIDSGHASALHVKKELDKLDLHNYSSLGGDDHEFFVSDIPTKFQEVAELFLGKPLKKISKIDLEKLIGND